MVVVVVRENLFIHWRVPHPVLIMTVRPSNHILFKQIMKAICILAYQYYSIDKDSIHILWWSAFYRIMLIHIVLKKQLVALQVFCISHAWPHLSYYFIHLISHSVSTSSPIFQLLFVYYWFRHICARINLS